MKQRHFSNQSKFKVSLRDSILCCIKKIQAEFETFVLIKQKVNQVKNGWQKV